MEYLNSLGSMVTDYASLRVKLTFRHLRPVFRTGDLLPSRERFLYI